MGRQWHHGHVDRQRAIGRHKSRHPRQFGDGYLVRPICMKVTLHLHEFGKRQAFHRVEIDACQHMPQLGEHYPCRTRGKQFALHHPERCGVQGVCVRQIQSTDMGKHVRAKSNQTSCPQVPFNSFEPGDIKLFRRTD